MGCSATDDGGGDDDDDDGNINYNYANDVSKVQTCTHFSNNHNPRFKIKF
jgi:hypothetical protein